MELYEKAIAHAKWSDQFFTGSKEGYRLRAKNSFIEGYNTAIRELILKTEEEGASLYTKAEIDAIVKEKIENK